MPQHQAKPVINAHNLSKTFKVRGNPKVLSGMFDPQWRYVTAVQGLDIAIYEAESVAFLGPNGAGKTTTIKMLTGLVFPSEGSIEVLDYTPQQRESEFLHKIGLVMGNKAGLNWDLTARQSFDLLRQIYSLNTAQYQTNLEELTDLLRVEHVLDRQVRQMSLGERMKVELIGAVLHQPPVLFLDEPTIGLDVDAKLAVRDFVRFLQQERGTTVLLTSHDMLDVSHICDRAIVISDGRKIYDDSLTVLEQRYANRKFIDAYYSGELSFKAYDSLARKQSIIKQGHIRFEADQTQLKKLVSKLLDEDAVDDIQIEAVSLDTIMQDLFKQSRT